MKRLVVALCACVLMSVGLVSVSATSASAYPASPYIKKLAKKMKCKYGESDALATDAKVEKAWNCVVGAGTRNRREYYLMTYRNTERALDEWRDWTSCHSYDGDRCNPGYFARKGKVLVIDQASPHSYTKKYAGYAARRTDGRIVAGYKYNG